MKIILIGGHSAPALAVLDELPKDAEVVFIGRKHTLEGDETVSLEYKTITERGIRFIPITTGRIQRNISMQGLTSLLKVPGGVVQAVQILKKEKPDVVLGFGSYVSVPVCVAAKLLGIPVVIHEQTLEAGLANKVIGRFATKVCISWKQSERFFPRGKVMLTGNPVRKFNVNRRPHPTPLLKGEGNVVQLSIPLIYITGGSTGAHAVNQLVEGCLEKLLMQYRMIHQTGDAREYGDFDRLISLRAKLSKKLQERYVVTKFVKPEEVGSIMEWADLVVSRSGMNTITELLYFGKPCLFIPLSVGQRNEQLKNAQFVKKIGIGDYTVQNEISPDDFFAKIEHMIDHKANYLSHASSAKSLVHLDAAEHIIREVYEISESQRVKESK